MAPVATEPQHTDQNGTTKNLKAKDVGVFDPSDLQEKISSFNPFYSPPPIVSDGDYEYDRYRVRTSVMDYAH